MNPLISPSLLSADFTNLKADLDMINRSEADWLHCDVMDGTFVPNISFGFPVIEAVKNVCEKPLDVHLMIVRPEQYIDATARAGAMMMCVHQEAVVHLNRVVHQIHDAGMKAGVALNPSTPVCMLEDVIADVDMVLLMSVNPGFGGQSFIDSALRKTEQARRRIEQSGRDIRLQVDGGIKPANIRRVANAGADTFVAGSAIFGQSDYAQTIAAMRQALA